MEVEEADQILNTMTKLNGRDWYEVTARQEKLKIELEKGVTERERMWSLIEVLLVIGEDIQDAPK